MLLVTTALEETWQDSEHILFLGEWCKLYNQKLKWEKIDHSVAPVSYTHLTLPTIYSV